MPNIKKIKDKIKKYLKLAKLIYKDKRTPKVSKCFLWLALAYALSPIDLIPDFIPVIGFIDDLVLLPILLLCAFVFIPRKVYISNYRKIFKKN